MLIAIKENDLHFGRRISVLCKLAHCNPRCPVPCEIGDAETWNWNWKGKESREVVGLEEEKGRYKRKGKGLANNAVKVPSTSSKVNCTIILFIMEPLIHS